MATKVIEVVSKSIFKIISTAANTAGVRVYVAGQYVRDYFMGHPCNDIDIVVEGNAINVANIVAQRTHHKLSVFKNFGTARLECDGDRVQFQNARRLFYPEGAHKPVIENGRIEDYQQNCDFTINSIAVSLNSDDYGQLIDTCGGIKDISLGIIRTPVQAIITFSDDRIRLLRAIRFVAQLSSPSQEFHLSPECMEAIRNSAEQIDSVSKERIVEELNRMLLTDVPSKAISLLDQVGILKRILPDLAATKGGKSVAGEKHEETFSHSLMVLDNIAKFESSRPLETTNSLGIKQGEPNLWLRWTALLHDIGKPAAKRYVKDKGWTFYGYTVIGSKMIPKVFSSLKMSQNDNMKYVQKLISLQNRPKELLDRNSTESAFRRLLFDAGEDIDDLMLLCEANITTKNKAKGKQEFAEMESVWKKLSDVREKDEVKNFKNPISANHIMEIYGLDPCDLLSTLKNSIKDAILRGEIGNSFEEADSYLRKIAAEMGLISCK